MNDNKNIAKIYENSSEKKKIYMNKTLLLFFYFAEVKNAADINGCFREKKVRRH